MYNIVAGEVGKDENYWWFLIMNYYRDATHFLPKNWVKFNLIVFIFLYAFASLASMHLRHSSVSIYTRQYL